MKRRCMIFSVVAVCLFFLLCMGSSRLLYAADDPKTPLSAAKSTINSAKQQSTDADPAAEGKKSGPKIKFEDIIYDFGKIAPNVKNNCEFKFTNEGDDLLEITRTKADCGCTTPTLDKKQYKAGESGVIKVEYRSGGPGKTAKHIYVYTNDKNNSTVTLTLKADVIKKVDFEPKTMSLYLKKPNAGAGNIRIFSLDNQPFAIKHFSAKPNRLTTADDNPAAEPDCMTADIDPSVEKTEFILKPRVNMDALRENLNGRITITLTHPECKTVVINFNALPEFRFQPANILAFNLQPQKPVDRELWLLSNYNQDFEVESVSFQRGFVKVLSQEKVLDEHQVGNRYKLQLQITPPVPEKGARMFTDVVSVTLKGGRTLEVQCRGFYAK